MAKSNAPRAILTSPIAAVVCLVSVGAIGISATSQEQRPGALSGVVVDSSSRSGLPGSVVRLVGSGGHRAAVDADEQGRFVFSDLPAQQSYRISVQRTGYFPGGHGRDSWQDSPLSGIALSPGEWRRDIRITLWRLSSIVGVVRDDKVGPIGGVTVQLLSRRAIGGELRLVVGSVATTDQNGGFEFSNLAAGRYLVLVPSVQSTVPKGTSRAALGLTDEALAASRTFDFGAGLLLVDKAAPPVDSASVYSPTFAPGVLDSADATAIDLITNDRKNVNVILTASRAFSITGKIEPIGGRSVRAVLRLLRDGSEDCGPSCDIATTLLGASGDFVFLHVPRGRYRIERRPTVGRFAYAPPGGAITSPRSVPGFEMASVANRPITAAPPGVVYSVMAAVDSNWWADGKVTVDENDVEGVRLEPQPVASLSGTVVLDAAETQLQRLGLSVVAEHATADPSAGMPSAFAPPADSLERAFTVTGLIPGRYRLRVNAPSGWVVKSVTRHGREYLDEVVDVASGDILDGFRVQLTRQAAIFAGRLDSASMPSRVVVFSADKLHWNSFGLTPIRFRILLPAADGSYRVEDLPAGSYLVAPVPDIADLPSLKRLSALSATATPFVLVWGQTTNVNVRTTAKRNLP